VIEQQIHQLPANAPALASAGHADFIDEHLKWLVGMDVKNGGSHADDSVVLDGNRQQVTFILQIFRNEIRTNRIVKDIVIDPIENMRIMLA
jgi:hypothetical protein